jgi:hypothetical protein
MPTRTGQQTYSAFGLSIASDFALPELFVAKQPGQADAQILVGAIPETCSREPGVHPCGEGTILNIPDVATYWITGGCRIVVQPGPNAEDANVRLYLLGSAMGVLLHQRRLLPLHANAVEIGRAAFAFMGPSGAGKSTLAAWFHDQGHRVVADDVSVVTIGQQGQPLVHPGVPRLRLWRQALERSGRSATDHPLSWRGDPSYDKYDVSIQDGRASQRSQPLGAVYLLEASETFHVERVSGAEAADVIFANTYRGHYVQAANSEVAHWTSVMQLIRTTPVFRVARPWSLEQLDAVGHRILEHVEAVAAMQGAP